MAVFLFGVDYAGIGSHLLLKACSDRQRIVGKVFTRQVGSVFDDGGFNGYYF